MSSAQAQRVYGQAPYQEPDEAQETFARQYNLSQPEVAMSTYQRIMHQHTKQQFDMAQSSSRRRSNNTDMTSLSTETSHGSMSSVSSTAS